VTLYLEFNCTFTWAMAQYLPPLLNLRSRQFDAVIYIKFTWMGSDPVYSNDIRLLSRAVPSSTSNITS